MMVCLLIGWEEGDGLEVDADLDPVCNDLLPCRDGLGVGRVEGVGEHLALLPLGDIGNMSFLCGRRSGSSSTLQRRSPGSMWSQPPEL